ncbi:MAG: sulfite exporter TauE/SafE family protein [Blastocatellia bacterium]|nr:sulfite exporter TauE/SafE family protein [Blastocatellia bacterium]
MGGGGSILTVPIFVYVLQFQPKEAIAMGLGVVGATSIVGTIGHWRAGNLDLKVAATFGLIAMLSTYSVAKIAEFIPGYIQLSLFALVMISSALFMFRSKTPKLSEETRHEVAFVKILLVATSIGLLTGIVGVGGGFLIVPALVLLAKIEMKRAVGSSLLVISMNSVAGFLGYVDHVKIDWKTMLSFTAVAIMGSFLGTYLTKYVSQSALKRSFAIFLIFMGVLIFIQNWTKFSK